MSNTLLWLDLVVARRWQGSVKLNHASKFVRPAATSSTACETRHSFRQSDGHGRRTSSPAAMPW
jgi:hypothetical protein